MADPVVTEIWNGRAASVDAEGVGTYARVFRVVTSDPVEEASGFFDLPGIPQQWDTYVAADGLSGDTEALAQKIEFHQTDDPRVWECRVDYSTKVDPELGNKNPLNRPAEIKWGTERFSKAIDKDVFGAKLTNSAGEPFDPPVEVDDFRITLSITRAEASFNPLVIFLYSEGVNSKSWNGLEPHTVKLNGISAERAYEHGVLYWKVSYEFHIRTDTWDLSILDAGFSELDVNGNRIVIRDKTGQPLTAPALLDGAGKKLPVGGTPEYLTKQVYDEIDFTPLSLEFTS